MNRPVSRPPQGHDEQTGRDDRALHSQRLETLGILAAKVAHDLGNVLVTILGEAELLAEDLAPGDPVRDRVDAIVLAGRDARALVRQLVLMAGSSSEPVSVDPNTLVDEALVMFKAVAPAGLVVEWERGEGARPVVVDAVQVRQSLLNLLLNAAAAVSGEGMVRVSVAPAQGTELGTVTFVTRSRPVPNRTYVAIAVRDSGSGMAAEVLERAFEPFFSTRSEGTGLGLPAVLAAVTGHRGLVQAESTPGEGSTFTLYFPASSRGGPRR